MFQFVDKKFKNVALIILTTYLFLSSNKLLKRFQLAITRQHCLNVSVVQCVTFVAMIQLCAWLVFLWGKEKVLIRDWIFTSLLIEESKCVK